MSKNRCVISFIDNKKHLILEMYYLFESFIQSEVFENTDLILCGPIEITEYIPKHDSVIFLPTESITENRKDDKYKIFNNYHYMNSISCITLNKDWLLSKKYKYILKTDSDVFITPNFKDFFPPIEKLYTGTGGYSNKEVQNKLREIAKRENLNYKEMTNIGATWYGLCKNIIDIAELTMKITGSILEKDFLESHGSWPNWYRGVSSMYGSELAINHLINKNGLIVSFKFDGMSDSSSLWKETGVYHIHCWHTDKLYSKFQNINGSYIDYKIDNLDYNKINEYCLSITLKHKDKLINTMNSKAIISTYQPNFIVTFVIISIFICIIIYSITSSI